VDLFIVYDNIKYTKRGWTNRNRMLQNGTYATFSLPVQKGSDALDVRQREVADDFKWEKFLNRMRGAYQKAPFHDETMPLIEDIVRHGERNLFGFLRYSLERTCEHLGLGTEIRASSAVPIDHTLRGQEKVLALCEATQARTYINAIGGMDLYCKTAFKERDLKLAFIQSKPFEYPQLGDAFVAGLSIIDVMMFNSREAIHQCISSNYELVSVTA
jgi:hypothetical protein